MPEREAPSDVRISLLLVDDEKGYVQVLAKRMRKRRIDVTPAFSGQEAIRILRKRDFDVAL
ncbi:MAG: response regulator, partial [Syntrophobacteraceae bacterium]|nr:response regulator [Syntrophobacteraceae bacterium]